MPTNFIEHPELNRLYLIKRNKSGSAAKRAQPGKILEFSTNSYGGRVVKVQWLYDDVHENVNMFYGLVKDLTPKWIHLERDRLIAESASITLAINELNKLASA